MFRVHWKRGKYLYVGYLWTLEQKLHPWKLTLFLKVMVRKRWEGCVSHATPFWVITLSGAPMAGYRLGSVNMLMSEWSFYVMPLMPLFNTLEWLPITLRKSQNSLTWPTKSYNIYSLPASPIPSCASSSCSRDTAKKHSQPLRWALLHPVSLSGWRAILSATTLFPSLSLRLVNIYLPFSFSSNTNSLRKPFPSP